jgi:hypothetical protein
LDFSKPKNLRFEDQIEAFAFSFDGLYWQDIRYRNLLSYQCIAPALCYGLEIGGVIVQIHPWFHDFNGLQNSVIIMITFFPTIFPLSYRFCLFLSNISISLTSSEILPPNPDLEKIDVTDHGDLERFF